MERSINDPGSVLASTVTSAAALGFVPVAAHFDLFSLLVKFCSVTTTEALTAASNAEASKDERHSSPLCVALTEDTLYAMTSLGFVDMVGDNLYQANDITRHIAAVPSAIHGMILFTTETLFGAAFLMRQLMDTNFDYPFKEYHAPIQHGYKLMGQEQYANKDIYSIMHLQGRLPSFNKFMEGKFAPFGTMPERVVKLGYDLDTIALSNINEIVMVDIGGGQGQMLLEMKQAYPHLGKQSLVLQEHNPDMERTEELTIMDWDFKSDAPNPTPGAVAYSLTHIFHNMADLQALTLMKKISNAMAPYSRLLIHEFPKNPIYGKMNASMVVLLGGKERSSREWHQMAGLAGLQVTFEAYPLIGEGLVEMRKK